MRLSQDYIPREGVEMFNIPLTVLYHLFYYTEKKCLKKLILIELNLTKENIIDPQLRYAIIQHLTKPWYTVL